MPQLANSRFLDRRAGPAHHDFFKENPQAVLDPQLLLDLNNMALRLVEPSPIDIESHSSILPDDTDVRNASNLQLKQMLGERLLNDKRFQDLEVEGGNSNDRQYADTTDNRKHVHRKNSQVGKYGNHINSSSST